MKLGAAFTSREYILRIAPWEVRAWPSVSIPAAQFADTASQYRMLGMSSTVDHGGLHRGHVVYGSALEHGCAAVAWEWAEMSPRVVALTDPMTIITNIRLFDDDLDSALGEDQLLHLHALIHSVAWQREVCLHH